MTAPPTPPTFDAAAAYPQVGEARAALAARDWPALRAVVDAQDAYGRTVLVDEVGDASDVEDFLRATAAERPDDPLPGTMLGAHLIDAGWRIRTDHRAQHVSRDQFDQFFDHLRRAEQVLIDVTARHPDESAAWTQRITSARGLQLGQAEARRRYDRLAAHQPHHLPAQRSLLQQFCPKWSGDWERAHGFARECVAAAPAGGPHAVLIVEAHLEQALDDGGLNAARTYLTAPRVRAEIAEAAQRSVGHPAFRHTWGWPMVRSTFAFAYCLMEDWTAAARQFAALGAIGHTSFFDYLRGDGEKQFLRYREKAYAKGGRP
ncbi:hypothetical protein [Micromonospora endolithica]|uniref:hypothetical protein n=1 Tax=Micromonospora endolithica TaxID=230091 RepID=UPI0011BEBA16|nr:hypothetical protein [Micromonospora endolithica]